MSPSRWNGLVVLAVGLVVSGASASDGPRKDSAPQAESGTPRLPDQADLDRKFAENLSGVVFAGSYSATAGKDEKPAQMEKYTITRVSKLKDDYWLFATRIQFAKKDVTLPLTLQVKWAGDTPVITLTDLTIPPLGTFTSRVMIYGDRYAGTWQHDKTGGHLWGRIEKIEKPAGSVPAEGKPSKTDADGGQ